MSQTFDHKGEAMTIEIHSSVDDAMDQIAGLPDTENRDTLVTISIERSELQI